MENQFKNGLFLNKFEHLQPLTKLKGIFSTLGRVKWRNLTIALLILCGFLYGVISMASDISTAYPTWQEERNQAYLEKELAKYQQVEVLVQPGDTAWRIQEDLTANGDIRHMLYLAKEVNGSINWGSLVPGEKIIFLQEKQ